jgi:serpin B
MRNQLVRRQVRRRHALGAGVVVAGLLAAAGCGSSSSSSVAPAHPATGEPVVLTVPATPDQVVLADDGFAASLLPLAGSGNVVLSPLSISTALQMVLQGARGETAAQMRSVLHLADNASAAAGAGQLAASLAKVATPTQLNIADTIWLQQGLKLQPDFTSTMSGDFAAGFKQVDFVHSAGQVTNSINKTISDQTRGKIANLFAPGILDASTRLVLANAIYLKAQWQTPFTASATAPAPFHPASGPAVSVPTMHETGAFGFQQGAGYQAVTLPYSDGRLAMTIVIPTGSLQGLESSLSASSLAAMVKPGPTTGIDLALPKFSFGSSLDLGQTLQTLGMKDAFGDADFSGITTQESLNISAVIHKAVIDVDETGTEAAAATGIAMAASAMLASKQISVDKPFLFAITDTTTGAPLFLGNVENPAG